MSTMLSEFINKIKGYVRENVGQHMKSFFNLSCLSEHKMAAKLAFIFSDSSSDVCEC